MSRTKLSMVVAVAALVLAVAGSVFVFVTCVLVVFGSVFACRWL